MKRIVNILLIAILSIAVMSAGALAATHSKEEGQESGSQMEFQAGESIKWAKNAKEILDKKIVSPDGKELGTADDIVIGTDGSIEYIVLKASGSEKLEQGEYAIPWDAVKSDAKVDTLVAEIDQMEIEKYTKEKKKQQKQQARLEQPQQQQGMKTAEGEQDQIQQQQQGMKAAEGQQEQQKQGKEIAELEPKRARDVLGKKVMSKNDEELGTADNIYISDEGKALFVIVQSKEDDNKMRPIPADMVHKDPEGDNLKAEVEKEKFAQAPGFEQGKKPELAKSKWEQEIRGYYGDQGQQSGSGQMKKEQEMMKKEQRESKMEEKSSQTQ